MNIRLWIGRFEKCFICWKRFWHRGESLAYSFYCESQEDYVESACKKCSNDKENLKILEKRIEEQKGRELASLGCEERSKRVNQKINEWIQ